MKTPEQSDENLRIAVHEFGHYEACASFGINSSPKVLGDAEQYQTANGKTIVGECRIDACANATPFQQSVIGWAGYLAEYICGVQVPQTRNPFPLKKFCLKDFYRAAEAEFEKTFSQSDQSLICAYKNHWVSFAGAYQRLRKKKAKILRLSRLEKSICDRVAENRRVEAAKWAGVPRPPGEPATHADFVRVVCGDDPQRFERYIVSRAEVHLCGGAAENFEDTKKSMLNHFLGSVADELRARHAGKADAEIAGVLFDENFASILKLQRRIYGGDFPDGDAWFAAARDFLNWAASEKNSRQRTNR